MTLHIGDTFDRDGERLIVKRVLETTVIVEDEEGFAFPLPYEPSMEKRGYTVTVDSDGWVRSFDDEPDEDSVENREGDPAFNGAFNAW